MYIKQFSPPICHFIPLLSKYSPQHPIFKHPKTMVLLKVRDEVLYIYKTRRNIILLCIVEKTQSSELNDMKHCQYRNSP
jgi:hypothetical protein